MNDIDRIKLEVINNRLKYNELLELYIRYLKIRQRMMNKIPSYRNDYKYYVNSRNTNCYAYAFRFDLPDYFDEAFKYFDSIDFILSLDVLVIFLILIVRVSYLRLCIVILIYLVLSIVIR